MRKVMAGVVVMACLCCTSAFAAENSMDIESIVNIKAKWGMSKADVVKIHGENYVELESGGIAYECAYKNLSENINCTVIYKFKNEKLRFIGNLCKVDGASREDYINDKGEKITVESQLHGASLVYFRLLSYELSQKYKVVYDTNYHTYTNKDTGVILARNVDITDKNDIWILFNSIKYTHNDSINDIVNDFVSLRLGGYNKKEKQGKDDDRAKTALKKQLSDDIAKIVKSAEALGTVR